MPSATIIPVLRYPDVFEAAAWPRRAFGFAKRLRIGSHREYHLDRIDRALAAAGYAL